MPPDRTPPVPLNCPCCGTKLRVQARLSVGRTARCPECRSEIVIVEDGDSWRVETPATQPRPKRSSKLGDEPPPPLKTAAELQSELTDQVATVPLLQRAAQVARRPFVVVAAIACALAAISLYWLFGRAPPVPATRLPAEARPAAIVESIPAGNLLDEKPLDAAEPTTAAASTPDDESLSASPGPLRKDADIPTEPPARTFAETSPAPSNSQDGEPLSPEFADDPDETPRPFDIVASLRQHIESYEITQSRKLAELLPELAELVGAPIGFDDEEPDAAHPELKTLVRVQLRSTTVGAIVEAVCTAAGLAYRIEDDHLQLVPRE